MPTEQTRFNKRWGMPTTRDSENSKKYSIEKFEPERKSILSVNLDGQVENGRYTVMVSFLDSAGKFRSWPLSTIRSGRASAFETSWPSTPCTNPPSNRISVFASKAVWGNPNGFSFSFYG